MSGCIFLVRESCSRRSIEPTKPCLLNRRNRLLLTKSFAKKNASKDKARIPAVLTKVEASRSGERDMAETYWEDVAKGGSISTRPTR